MLDKQALTYLAEMDIDVWQTRANLVSQVMTEPLAWPLVIVIEPDELQVHIDLFKAIVAAMELEWQDVHCVSAAHFPAAYQAWVLWADPHQPAPIHPCLIECDPQRLLSDRQAKRILWQQICTQLLKSK
ncbi:MULTISPECIES: DNA polymerase III subunit psi [unclassified Agarivorans]|uniref:DNA polymerase III subunit psi n=1 Tax=unclassified Agarivorans TaxID=2636026 RepID=UPI003D7C4562